MNRKNMLILTMALLVVSAACTIPFTIQSTDNLVATLAAQTVQAWQDQNIPTQAPLDTQTPYPTQTQYPTFTPPASQTPYPTYTQPASATPKAPATATPLPCNQAVFVSETVPDGTKFSAGAEFTKSWRLKNIGTCTWNPSYKLVFVDGSQMGSPASVKLDDYVAPGEKTDVLVDLTAPAKPGTYTGYWRLQADDGFKFAQVYVQIQVPSTAFAVTSVNISADPASYNGACPMTFSLSADITASAAGKVTYKWKTSDGTTTALKTITFDKKGTKTVELDWQATASGAHWAKLYIDTPNHQWFGPIDIPVTCS
jgi:hypothetical protein